MAVAYLYTGGPIPIAYTPFGELTAGLFMGVIIIGISFFIQTGTVTSEVVLLSIPSSILIGAILLSNNIRDLDGDKENGRKTLAILVGRERAIGVLASMFIVTYIWTIALIIVNIVSPWMLIVFLSAPKAWKATKGFIGKSIPMEMAPAMIATAKQIQSSVSSWESDYCLDISYRKESLTRLLFHIPISAHNSYSQRSYYVKKLNCRKVDDYVNSTTNKSI